MDIYIVNKCVRYTQEIKKPKIMKTTKMYFTILTWTLFLLACFAFTNSFAQSTDMSKMKDCCMMKDGKMMTMKDGKMMPMKKEMTMKNGTICMVNCDCIMKDGTKMKMENGDCIYDDGKMEKCAIMMKDEKSSNEGKEDKATAYTCSMHPEISSDKPGKCPKCNMELIEKK